MTTSPEFTVTGGGAVRHITLDRPDRRNAQTLAMWRGLDRVTAELSEDPQVRAVVLRGAGGSFSAGLDLDELADTGELMRMARTADAPPDSPGSKNGNGDDREAAMGWLAEVQHAFLWARRSPFVVVAAVEGVAIGAGMELALACDVRIVADDARLRLPEVAMGVVPDLGGCHLLRNLVGYERALDLVVRSRWISGVDAVTLGLALGHEPAGRVEQVAVEYAEAVAAAPGRAALHAKSTLREKDDVLSLSAAAAGMIDGLRRGR